MKDLKILMSSLYETGDYFIEADEFDNTDYDESYWGKVVDPDGKKRNLLLETEQQIKDTNYVWKFVNGLSSGTILDVGCGLGSFLSAVSNDWAKYGIELSKTGAEISSQYGDIHQGKLSDCPFLENQFDVVTMYHVIEHVHDPVSNLKIIQRLLKKNGIFIIGTPDFDSGCARRFGEDYRLLGSGHIRLFSNDSMHRFLRDHNFKINKVEYNFFNTRHFTKENLLRLFDKSKVSPPFYGNYMTFFCTNVK